MQSMKQEVNLLPSEPQTHLASRYHWREWILCEDYSLTVTQLHLFYHLKSDANILFEGQNERWDLIKQLYQMYFKEPGKTSGKQFMKLGFQSQYPESDFRGGGILSLLLIIGFVKNQFQLVREMENDSGNFFFAITAINLTFFMKKYFHLAEFLVPQRDEHVYCSRRALKNFCNILQNNHLAFHCMHQLFLRYLYSQKWVADKHRPDRLLRFNTFFSEVTKRIQLAFEEHNFNTYQQFLMIWNIVRQ